METQVEIFIDHWHQIALIWSQVALAIAGLIMGYYLLLMTTKSTIAEKYKFVSLNEIKYFWYTALALTISFALFLNSLIVREHETSDNFALTIKVVICGAIAFLIGFMFNKYLNVYYPFKLEKSCLNSGSKREFLQKIIKQCVY
jgi:hypothetical protein